MATGARFTDRYIASLKPEEKEYWLREGMGFSLRVLPSGEKLWYYIYTFQGRKRFMRLGKGNYPEVSLADARGQFDIAKVKVKNGIDPLSEEQQTEQEHRLASTIALLAKEYIEKWAKPRKRSWEGDQRTLNVEIIPKWGKRKAKDIKRRDVVLLLEEIAERAPIMANRTRALLSKMFNFAIEREIVENNPCIGTKTSVKEEPVERSLSEEETREVWAALSTPGTLYASPEITRALKLILVTGQRPGEVVGMHRKEIINDRWWFIPAERAKNKQAHMVYLTDMALELIGDKSGFIFESPVTGRFKADGTPRETQPIAVNALAHVVRRSIEEPKEQPGQQHTVEPVPQEDATQGEPDTIRRKLIMQPWTPHDLRRTCATMLSKLGHLDEIIDVVLNHKKKGIVATYNRNLYEREKQAAMESWERKLKAIITGAGADNVVSITTAKGNRKAA